MQQVRILVDVFLDGASGAVPGDVLQTIHDRVTPLMAEAFPSAIGVEVSVGEVSDASVLFDPSKKDQNAQLPSETHTAPGASVLFNPKQ
jgi:hypothetical protein